MTELTRITSPQRKNQPRLLTKEANRLVLLNLLMHTHRTLPRAPGKVQPNGPKAAARTQDLRFSPRLLDGALSLKPVANKPLEYTHTRAEYAKETSQNHIIFHDTRHTYNQDNVADHNKPPTSILEEGGLIRSGSGHA